jgi:hypothetical protein
MELAGLEPATSWVRFGGRLLRPLANGRHPPKQAGHRAIRFVAGRRASSRLLDQPLTKRAVVPRIPWRRGVQQRASAYSSAPRPSRTTCADRRSDGTGITCERGRWGPQPPSPGRDPTCSQRPRRTLKRKTPLPRPTRPLQADAAEGSELRAARQALPRLNEHRAE